MTEKAFDHITDRCRNDMFAPVIFSGNEMLKI